MARSTTPKPKGYKAYDSTTHHKDKGDYRIRTSKGYSYDIDLNSGQDSGVKYHWSASLDYQTKTRRFILIGGDRAFNPRWKNIPAKKEDTPEDEALSQKAYDRLLPILELYREYRGRTGKRYEVLRMKDSTLPIVPVLPEEQPNSASKGKADIKKGR